MNVNLEALCLKTCEVARTAGKFILEERKKFSHENVIEKGKRNFVSYVDVTVEKICVEGLKNILPEAGFLTEEKTVNDGNESLRWIVDPLEGTTNFIHGVPPFAVSIALQYEKEMVLDVVYEVNLDECFYGWHNGGAFLNGNKISVTQITMLRSALTATGFPYDRFQHFDRFFSTLKFLFNNTHGVRRLGSAAVDLVYVACGRFDAFYEYNLNAWDVAACALVVREAGGVVSDMNGADNYLFGKSIVASNKNLYNEFFQAVVNLTV